MANCPQLLLYSSRILNSSKFSIMQNSPCPLTVCVNMICEAERRERVRRYQRNVQNIPRSVSTLFLGSVWRCLLLVTGSAVLVLSLVMPAGSLGATVAISSLYLTVSARPHQRNSRRAAPGEREGSQASEVCRGTSCSVLSPQSSVLSPQSSVTPPLPGEAGCGEADVGGVQVRTLFLFLLSQWSWVGPAGAGRQSAGWHVMSVGPLSLSLSLSLLTWLPQWAVIKQLITHWLHSVSQSVFTTPSQLAWQGPGYPNPRFAEFECTPLPENHTTLTLNEISSSVSWFPGNAKNGWKLTRTVQCKAREFPHKEVGSLPCHLGYFEIYEREGKGIRGEGQTGDRQRRGGGRENL